MAPLPRNHRTAPGHVDRLHEAAIDAASETDRRWFLAHPGTGWYIRLPTPTRPASRMAAACRRPAT